MIILMVGRGVYAVVGVRHRRRQEQGDKSSFLPSPPRNRRGCLQTYGMVSLVLPAHGFLLRLSPHARRNPASISTSSPTVTMPFLLVLGPRHGYLTTHHSYQKSGCSPRLYSFFSTRLRWHLDTFSSTHMPSRRLRSRAPCLYARPPPLTPSHPPPGPSVVPIPPTPFVLPPPLSSSGHLFKLSFPPVMGSNASPPANPM